MDPTLFKQDIDELLDDYSQERLTTLADMKKLWMDKKFSYIYESRPRTNAAFFMQSLFAHCIGHMVSSGALSQRLGGLYCLYCLYEIQPYKSAFKIYLSLGELKRLKDLVIDAKENGVGIVPALVKRMLKKNMFLFGFVDLVGGSVNQRADDIAKLQNKHVQVAYEKLLANNKIEDYLHMNLGVELDLQSLKKMSAEYAEAKELAVREVSQTVDVEDMKHITGNKKLVGNMVEEIVEEWDAQKEAFYKQTCINGRNEIVAVDGFDELEQLLDE